MTVKHYAIVEDGVVTNIAASETAIHANWIESKTARKGDLYNGTAFTKGPPTPPAPVVLDADARLDLLVDILLDGGVLTTAKANQAKRR